MKKNATPIPTDDEILAYNNVPPEVAAKYIGWTSHALRYALQDQRVPFGVATKVTTQWSYNISPGGLVKYKNGDLPAYTLKDLEAMVMDRAEQAWDLKLNGVSKVINTVLGVAGS